MFTLKQLKYFVAIAEHGSITAAAEALYVSQPGLSAAVGHLEQMLDVQLLIRHKAKGIELTPAGRTLLASSRELLSHADDVLASGRGLSSAREGPLHVGFFHTIGPHVMPGLLAQFRREFPNVHVTILEGDLAQLYTALTSGKIELALIYDLGLDEHIERCHLRRLQPYVLAPADSELAQHASISLRKLAGKPMIMLDLPHSREYFSMLFRSSGIEPRIAYYTKSVPMVRSLVANGHGYSILNFRPTVRAAYDGKELAYIDLKGGVSGLALVLAWHVRMRLSARAQAFIEVAQAYVEAHAGADA